MSAFTITKDNVPGFLAAVKRMTQDQVLVGIPSSTTERPGSPITNAALGYIHEFGSPRANIPARPFLYPGILSVQDQISTQLHNAGKQALGGDPDATTAALQGVGMIAASAVQKKITDGPFAPLAPSTLAARKQRGVTRTNPLMDTGALRRSITWTIRRKGT